jgi:hypothetical protein
VGDLENSKSTCVNCDCETRFTGPCPCENLDESEFPECVECCGSVCDDIDCNDCDTAIVGSNTKGCGSADCPCQCCTTACFDDTFCNTETCVTAQGGSCPCHDMPDGGWTHQNGGDHLTSCNECCTNRCADVDCDDCDAFGPDDGVGNCDTSQCPCECCGVCENAPCSGSRYLNGRNITLSVGKSQTCCNNASTQSDPHIKPFQGDPYTL